MDVLDQIRRAPMGRFQIATVVIALTLILIDGFDVAIMAYAAPALSREWHIPPSQLGFVLSASLFGMAAGSILLTPLADRIGRRKLTVISLVIISIGMLATVVATGTTSLIVYRIITGLGVGGMMANLNVLVSEYASDRRRGSILGIYAAGYPIGATVGGLVAGPMIPALGWRSVFAVGAGITVVMLVVTWRFLPESLDYLVTCRPAGALERVNAILRRLGAPRLTELPRVAVSVEKAQGSVAEVLTPPVLLRTLMLWIGYACLVAAYYFANTWTPKIMASVSGDDTLGVTAGVVANAGGIVGCFVFSALAVRFRSQLLLAGTLILAAVAYLVFGAAFAQLGLALVLALFLGLFTTGGIAGFYAVSPEIYTARARVTGVGWMIGVGRLVSIVAPILVGYLVDAGWRPENIFFLFALPLAVAAVSVYALIRALTRAGIVLGHSVDVETVRS